MTTPSPAFQALLDQLHPAHRAWLSAHDESEAAGEQVLLYGRADIEERNTSYEVQRYAPAFVAVADDSGGRQLMLRIDGGPRCTSKAWGRTAPARRTRSR